MRAAVIGYNIFAVGGTTQSNLNLLLTLNQHYDSTVYFNYLPFNREDVHHLKKRYQGLVNTKFALIKNLFDQAGQWHEPYDVIFITREDLFPLSKILRNINPKALIIGEVHTPLALLGDHLPGLGDLSCVRVATSSIQTEFEERYNFKRIYVQTVGLNHLKWGKIDDQLSTNFVVQSRFFEKQKDIMYSLRLINDLKQHGKTDFHLYIQGTGADEFDYRSYIDGNHLRSMVSINRPLPRHYTYLSTSKFETLGYSIAETIAQGHQVLAYLGDDDVIYENFKNVPMVHWIEKHSLAEDADKMITISQHAATADEFEQSQTVLKAMATDYYSKFVDRTRQFEDLEFNFQPVTDKDKLQIQQTIEHQLGPLNPGLARRMYYRIIKAPIFKKIFMTNYVLTSDIYKGYKHAGPKAKADINQFLGEVGYQILDLDLPIKRIQKLGYRIFKLPHLFKNKDADKIIFQYPMYTVFLTKAIIKEVRRQTNAKLIFVIHDYEAIRKYKGDQKFFKDEVAIFNAVDCLIVHSQAMKDKMRQNGVTTSMVILGVFDYYNPQKLVENHEYHQSICFAGNLEKSSFLTKLKLQHSHAYLFGMDPAPQYPANISYEGLYQAEELPKYLKGDFGLVWDGTSLDGNGGIYADYQHYNAPHKTSLYLSSGMPVIVWKQAAISQFILDEHVGIAVENLENLDKTLQNISADEYFKLQANAQKLAVKLRNGMMIKNAIHQAEEIIDQNGAKTK